MSLPPLPIDSHIDDVRAALDRRRAAVLMAAPGAGKTTRVPPALIDGGRVLLLQPRRIAARAMTRRIADERGWTVGREIGWHIRFERQFTAQTRLLIVTEGILTAYLQTDPLLSDVRTVILDEFHERSIHADVGLALAKQAWSARDDLRILIMSATLDAAPLTAFLDDCPLVQAPGTLHPMQVEYAPGRSIPAALDSVLPRTPGNVLCFLPGAREIEQAALAAAPVASRHDTELVALHGSLPARDQDEALSPSARRVILATNIAETSLTVPGVTGVIDSGLHKVARYDADRAIDSLTTERITLDSAEQRAGRAARLGPGLVNRLWDGRDRLRPHREADIHRIDLSAPLLQVLAAGAALAIFEWFDRPAPDRVAAAIALLTRLGAVEGGRITARGRQLQRLPLPPRLARIVLEAGGAFEACAACAWLAQPTRLDNQAATSSDLLTVLDRWPRMPAHLKAAAADLERIASSILGGDRRKHIDETGLRRALLAGYADRVAKRRSAGKATLANGHGAAIARESGVHDADWLIALDVTAGRTTATTEALIRVASRIEPEWLTPTHSGIVQRVDAAGEIKASAIDYYEQLPLREHAVAVNDEMRAALLAAEWLQRPRDERTARLLARAAFAGIDIDLPSLAATAAASAQRVSDIAIGEDLLPWAARQALDRLAPEKLKVPSGREMTIAYEPDGTVSVAVKLQELFGLAATPVIGPQRMPVTFHLLAPNARPVQTTRDLESFWERTYPEVRKELRGRYPRHPWPEDPWNATPTHKTKRR